MPLSGSLQEKPVETPYFTSLDELDNWAATPKQKLRGILPYKPRRDAGGSTRGRLLVSEYLMPFDECLTCDRYAMITR